MCNYSDPTTSANAVLEIATTPGLSASLLKTTADAQASAQQVTPTALPGIGDAAYQWVLNDASTNVSHVATTTLIFSVGTTLIDITAEATPAHVQALAHAVLQG